MKYLIKIKDSLGDIRLSMNENEVIELLGNPSEVEVLEEEGDEFYAIIWYYDDKNLSLFFNEDMDLFCIESDHQDLELFGKKIHKMKAEDLIALFKENGYSDFDREEESWGEMRLSVENAEIDFYFNNNELISVNFGLSESA